MPPPPAAQSESRSSSTTPCRASPQGRRTSSFAKPGPTSRCQPRPAHRRRETGAHATHAAGGAAAAAAGKALAGKNGQARGAPPQIQPPPTARGGGGGGGEDGDSLKTIGAYQCRGPARLPSAAPRFSGSCHAPAPSRASSAAVRRGEAHSARHCGPSPSGATSMTRRAPPRGHDDGAARSSSFGSDLRSCATNSSTAVGSIAAPRTAKPRSITCRRRSAASRAAADILSNVAATTAARA